MAGMTSMQGNGATPPAPAEAAAESAKYAALAKELGINPDGGQVDPPAKPPAEPPAPEPPPTPVPPAPDAPPAPRESVPYAEHQNLQNALKESRDAHKAEQERNRAILQIIEAARRPAAPPPPEPPKVPDVLEDPIGYFQARDAAREKEVAELRQKLDSQNQQSQAFQQEQALWSAVDRFEADIRDPRSPAHKADYDQACDYLEGFKVRLLDNFYPDNSPQVQQYASQMGLTPQQLKWQLLQNDRRQIAIQAFETNRSPAVMYYELAVAAGYASKGAAAPAKNGGLVPGGVPSPEAAKAAIEAARRGAQAAVTISGGGGRKGAADMSQAELRQLAEDDPAAFDKVWDEMARTGRLG